MESEEVRKRGASKRGRGGNQGAQCHPARGDRTFSQRVPVPPSGPLSPGLGSVWEQTEGKPQLRWKTKSRQSQREGESDKKLVSTLHLLLFFKEETKQAATGALVWDCSASQSGRWQRESSRDIDE